MIQISKNRNVLSGCFLRDYLKKEWKVRLKVGFKFEWVIGKCQKIYVDILFDILHF